MIIRIENMDLKDGAEMFFKITQEQWWMIEKLKEIGALSEDFSFSEIEIEDMT